MKKIFIVLFLLGLIIIVGLYARRKYYDPKHRLNLARTEVKKLQDENEIKDGDLIFQTSLSRQSKAIQLATKSKYSHCGIIFRDSNKYYVFEAVQTVRFTPLEKWIARGQKGKFVIKRLKNSDEVLTPSVLSKMKEVCKQFKGKKYDLTFEWSDDKIYCSELIWKIYQQSTGIEIGKIQKLRDFDLSNDAVKIKMRERYGNNIPLGETVISPVSIFNCDLLTTLKSNE